MLRFLLSLAWAISIRLNKTIFGRDWSGLQYLLVAFTAAMLSLLLGFGGGVAFGLGMIVVTVCDSETSGTGMTYAERDPLLSRVIMYTYATFVVTIPVALACMAAHDLAHAVVAGSVQWSAFLHQPGILASGIWGDVLGLTLGTSFFLFLDPGLLGLITDRLGYAVLDDGTVVRK